MDDYVVNRPESQSMATGPRTAIEPRHAQLNGSRLRSEGFGEVY